MTTHQVMLCFVRSDSSILQESWLNRAASWLAGGTSSSPPYIHAELLFVPQGGIHNTEEVSGQACSIVYNGTVHLHRKRFSRSEWFFRSMNVTKKQYDTMYNFCRAHVGEPFNKLGYFLAWTPLLAPRPSFYTWLGMSHRWYCSEIVVAALKEGRVLDENYPSTVHPNTLYHDMKNKTMVDCGRNVNEVTISFGC